MKNTTKHTTLLLFILMSLFVLTSCKETPIKSTEDPQDNKTVDTALLVEEDMPSDTQENITPPKESEIETKDLIENNDAPKEEQIATKEIKPVSPTKKEQKSIPEPVKTETPVTENKTETPKQTVRTDGFNYNGHHYDIASFSGSGHVPKNTNSVYRWAQKPNHYLVERISPAGKTINSLNHGSTITINGNTYTVSKIEYNIDNDTNTLNLVMNSADAITIQTCTTKKGANGDSKLNIWFAN